MIFINAIGRFFRFFIDHIFSLTVALLLCQLPQFMSQYVDALTGALHEAERSVDEIRNSAAQTGKTIEEFITKHLTSPDTDFKASGEIMQHSVQKEAFYREAITSIKEASLYAKPFVFIKYYESNLGSKIDFKPALPLTLESAIYALIGILVGTGLFRLFIMGGRTLFRRKKSSAVV